MAVNDIYWHQVDSTPRPPGTRDPHYHELRNFWAFVRDNDKDNAEQFLRRFPASIKIPIRADDHDEGAPGDQAIHIAAHMGHVDMIDYLMSKGAGIEDANTKTGTTPLMAAAMSNKASAVEHLLKEGAKIDAQDNQGSTALWYTAHFSLYASAQALLLAHADIEARDNGRRTPLLIAILNQNDPLAILLLGHGAKTHIADKDGNTPFSLILAREVENNTGRRMRELLTQRSAEEQDAERVIQERQRQELIEEITTAAHKPVDLRGNTMPRLRLR